MPPPPRQSSKIGSKVWTLTVCFELWRSAVICWHLNFDGFEKIQNEGGRGGWAKKAWLIENHSPHCGLLYHPLLLHFHGFKRMAMNAQSRIYINSSKFAYSLCSIVMYAMEFPHSTHLTHCPQTGHFISFSSTGVPQYGQVMMIPPTIFSVSNLLDFLCFLWLPDSNYKALLHVCQNPLLLSIR